LKRGKRIHQFVITVTMDKKCLRRVALREVRDAIHGDFYCTELEDGDPGTFRIKSIKNKEARRR
jgi:hypothetical protein